MEKKIKHFILNNLICCKPQIRDKVEDNFRKTISHIFLIKTVPFGKQAIRIQEFGNYLNLYIGCGK